MMDCTEFWIYLKEVAANVMLHAKETESIIDIFNSFGQLMHIDFTNQFEDGPSLH